MYTALPDSPSGAALPPSLKSFLSEKCARTSEKTAAIGKARSETSALNEIDDKVNANARQRQANAIFDNFLVSIGNDFTKKKSVHKQITEGKGKGKTKRAKKTARRI